ncbi:DUF2970 domain-containing protein [Ottowia sp.]|uniref:DUF2970 domain-containing protein n=1 Tax=Ottowia sp. TaxID=1898956 RepID=UPI003A8C428D
MNTPPVKSSFWRSMRAVGWSLLGVRKNAEYEKDLAQVNPLHVVVVGVLALLLFVLGLVAVVHWVVGSAGGQ